VKSNLKKAGSNINGMRHSLSGNPQNFSEAVSCFKGVGYILKMVVCNSSEEGGKITKTGGKLTGVASPF